MGGRAAGGVERVLDLSSDKYSFVYTIPLDCAWEVIEAWSRLLGRAILAQHYSMSKWPNLGIVALTPTTCALSQSSRFFSL